MNDPSLKLVVAWSERRNLCSMVADRLRQHLPEEELLGAGDDALVVHTAETAEALRDRLSSTLADDEGLLVIEFEKWSGYGRAVDSTWLLARGH